ncbi:glycosyltransferase family 9 protein [Rhodovibrionaceae bacterium A322]
MTDENILIIKLGALGDFTLSLGACKAIRLHHPSARITLLTTAPYEKMAAASGLFDQIWLDERPPLWHPVKIWKLRQRLKAGRFARIYDLQRNDRTNGYFQILRPCPPAWVGKALGASHRYQDPDENRHISLREAEQLALAGITEVPLPDLSFVTADLTPLDLPEAYALLVPGGAPHRPGKRWPAASYAALAKRLATAGLTPLVLGTPAEEDEILQITRGCPQARSLLGKTALMDIPALAQGARLAVGNDTGPMHLIAAAGCPVVSLFSAESKPEKTAPRGPSVTTLQRQELSQLSLDDVWHAVQPLLADKS